MDLNLRCVNVLLFIYFFDLQSINLMIISNL